MKYCDGSRRKVENGICEMDILDWSDVCVAAFAVVM